MTRSDGPTPTGLGILLVAATRSFTDQLHAALEAAGYPEMPPSFGVVFKALRDDQLTASELAARLGVTKQAASKVVAEMRRRGLITATVADGDARAKPLRLTPEGKEVMAAGSAISFEIEQRIAEQLGPRAMATLKRSLATIVDAGGGADDLAHGRAKSVW